MALPAIRALAESNKFELHIACTMSPTQAMCTELKQFSDLFTRVWAIHTSHGSAQFLKTLFQIRRQRFDLSIILFPSASYKYNLMSWILGARRRVGSAYPDQPWMQLSWLNTHGVPVVPELHDVEQMLNLCSEASGVPPPPARDYGIPASPKQPHLVGIHAGCKREYSYKMWPIDRFIDTCNEILEIQQKARFRFFFGPDDQEHADRARKCLQRPEFSRLRERVEFPAGLSMAQLFTLTGECESFISNDSGLMHIASDLGCRTLGIIGPSDDRRTGPFGPNSRVVQYPIECRPCTHTNDPRRFRFRCIHPEMYCLTRIESKEVVRQWIQAKHPRN